jgi:hypothetical protein
MNGFVPFIDRRSRFVANSNGMDVQLDADTVTLRCDAPRSSFLSTVSTELPLLRRDGSRPATWPADHQPPLALFAVRKDAATLDTPARFRGRA